MIAAATVLVASFLAGVGLMLGFQFVRVVFDLFGIRFGLPFEISIHFSANAKEGES